MNILRKAKIAIQDVYIRNRIIAVLVGLVLFRLLSTVPIPGIDPTQLAGFLESNQFLGLLNIFSGGGLSSLSIVMLGVGPYITASIIMQLLTVMSPKLKAMYHEEGQAGRDRFNQISRRLTVPIAAIQGFALLMVLAQQGILPQGGIMQLVLNITVVTAGAMLVTWLGELMTEYGIGNGVSLLIFAGIVATLPASVQQLAFTFDIAQLPTYIGFLVAALVVIAGVVLISEAERPIPVVYSKQVRGGETYGGTKTYIPLRVNQAGVMPIIFALSILLFPQLLLGFIAQSQAPFWEWVTRTFTAFINNGLAYSLVYFVLVFLFTYFYTAITFDPDAMAENLQKNGAFVPGVRPGQHTSEFVGTILSRITFIGALFLGIIAVIPIAIQSATGLAQLAIGGTGLLIVVAVVIDLIKKIDAQISMRQY